MITVYRAGRPYLALTPEEKEERNERQRACCRRYYYKHREELLLKQKMKRAMNREQYKEYQREYSRRLAARREKAPRQQDGTKPIIIYNDKESRTFSSMKACAEFFHVKPPTIRYWILTDQQRDGWYLDYLAT